MYELIIYSILCFVLFYLVAKLSYKLNLIDIPNERKLHLKPTAFTGGIAIAIIILFALQFFEIFNVVDRKLNLILSLASLISCVGLIDDKYNLNVGGKLGLQIVPIFYLIAFESFYLHQLGDYNFFQLNLGVFKFPFTLICVLFLVNAFNYFDGLDGTLSFASISVLGILYFLILDSKLSYYLLIILLPLIIFILFNFSFLKLPKLFLGDSGSLLLGFIISFTLIHFANLNITHHILLAWSVSIFVFEFFAINLIRIKNNKNPFEAGRDHLHHLLLNENNSIFKTNFTICILNIIFFILGYLSFKYISSLFSLILFLLLLIIYLFIRNNLLKKLETKI